MEIVLKLFSLLSIQARQNQQIVKNKRKIISKFLTFSFIFRIIY